MRIGRTLTLAACLIAAAVIAWFLERTPRPLPADAPAEVFSAGRAMADVRVIAKAPHPVGSPANHAVRDHLVRRMTELGLRPQVRRMDSVAYRPVKDQAHVYAARVENLIGVLPGRDRAQPAVMVMAHYDSVPGSPGAADDAAGVAAGLEIIRALKARGAPARDVILLLTDGEESGLLGAGAFFRSDPLARRVGFVLNMEARGGGGRAQMFQTGPRNGQTIDLFRRTAVQPASSSLAVLVYERTPNDTDFTRSRAAGVPGLNYAFIARQFDYHSATSTPANLDQGALQDIGRQVLAAAEGAAFAPALPAETHDAVYAHLFGSSLLAYPPAAGWAILAAIAVLAVFGAARARKAGALDLRDVGRGAGAALYLLISAAALLRFARRATGVGFGFLEQRALLAQADRFEVAVVLIALGATLFTAAALACGRSRLLAAGLALAAGLGSVLIGRPDMIGLALGCAGAGLALVLFKRPAAVPGAWAGMLASGWAVALVLQVALPTAAPLVAWPLTLAALAAAASAFGAVSGATPRLVTAVTVTVGLAWLGGFIHGVYLGLDLPELLAAFAWLAAMLIWPLAHPAVDSGGRRMAIAVLAMGLALVGWVRFAEPWSSRFPQPSLVAYKLDLDSGRGWRVSLTPAAESAWTRSVLTADGGALGVGDLRPLFASTLDAAPARWIPAAGPALQLGSAAGGRIALRVVPPPGARLLVLDLKTDAVLLQPALNGRPAKLLRQPGQWTHIRWEAVPEGFEISFRPTARGVIEARYAAVLETWPAAATPIPKRPTDLMAFDISGSTVVTGSRRLAW